jgi:hypothetical protein
LICGFFEFTETAFAADNETFVLPSQVVAEKFSIIFERDFEGAEIFKVGSLTTSIKCVSDGFGGQTMNAGVFDCAFPSRRF